MGDPPRPLASLIGRQLGQYAVKSLIGRGASGTVYLAEDRALHRPVALKVLLGSLARSANQAEALQKEAQAAAPLRHPNIVRIYAAGVAEGVPFIAMEYVRGEPLDLFLRRQGKLAWQQSLHLGRQIVDALAEAHHHGIIHCDVKPANILLDVSGRARLTDFGIATVRQRQDGQQGPTRVIGTLPYMAPEQCRGDGILSPATDLYGLGASLYQMIAGEPPFVRQSAEAVLNCIFYETPTRLHPAFPEVPDDVSRLIAHLLEKAPEARPPSARDVSRRMAQLLQQNGGRSAFPEAIDSFLRDQMMPRGNHYVTPTAGSKPSRHDAARTTGDGLDGAQRLGEWTKVAVAALVLLVLCGTGYWYLLRPRTMMHLAPPAPATEFHEITPEVKTARWALPHLQALTLRWTPDSQSVLLALEGKAGTLASGASALVALTPGRERARILAEADGPAQDTRFGLAARPLTHQYALARGLDDAMLIPALLPGSPGVVELRLQHLDAAASSAIGLAKLPMAEAAPYFQNPWTRSHAGELAVHPEGKEAAVVIEDANGQYVVLISLHGAAPAPRRLTKTGAAIVSAMHYTPKGDRLLFLRRNSPGALSLCAVDTTNGQELSLLEGDLDLALAIAPEGHSVAVGVRQGNTVAAQLVTLDGSAPPRPLGAGRVCAGSWHASGEWLALLDGPPGSPAVVLHKIKTGDRKSLALPPATQQVVDIAVSPDGLWLAAACETDTGPTVVVVDLARYTSLSGGTSFERT